MGGQTATVNTVFIHMGAPPESSWHWPSRNHDGVKEKGSGAGARLIFIFLFPSS